MSETKSTPDAEKETPRVLSQDAKNALAEAEARRKAAYGEAEDLPAEEGGREGPEPTRYGDWEKKGITHDF